MSSLPKAKPVNSLSGEPAVSAPVSSAVLETTSKPVMWQRDLADAVRTIPELLSAVQLSPSDVPDVSEAAVESFRLLVPQSFVKRMRKQTPDDPLLLQVLPQQAERQPADGYVADPVGDARARQAPGLLQKYHGRALLIAAGRCAVHCRYCFRREYPYSESPRRIADWEPAIRQLQDSPEISEVILSGGDPLMLPDERFSWLVSRLDAIGHIERIRLHTRLPVVLPSRITEPLLETLLSARAQVITVVHANHAQEIADDCRAALRRLVTCGLPVLNQTVLLRKVNDTAAALEDLSLALTNAGVMPYYLHQLDRVVGTAHFEVPDDQARRLMVALRARLPGYAVPRLVREIAGEDNKTLLELQSNADASV